jgi:hypothetical protein
VSRGAYGAEIKAPGLALVNHPRHGIALWTKRRLRKPTECAATGLALAVGEEAYGPASSTMYRYERVAARVIER